jgi:hypothetical protein
MTNDTFEQYCQFSGQPVPFSRQQKGYIKDIMYKITTKTIRLISTITILQRDEAII